MTEKVCHAKPIFSDRGLGPGLGMVFVQAQLESILQFYTQNAKSTSLRTGMGAKGREAHMRSDGGRARRHLTPAYRPTPDTTRQRGASGATQSLQR